MMYILIKACFIVFQKKVLTNKLKGQLNILNNKNIEKQFKATYQVRKIEV